MRWRRAGFRCYWRWKSRPLGGRPQIETELRVLIRRMSVENPHCGAPRIHGELLKLGFEVAQSSVAKYMVKRRGQPSQGWRTFLRNHAPDIAAMDLFVAPTIGFDLLYAFVIVRLDRRDLVWINVTANPTAEWVARQLTEAFPWNEAPRYMIRDRDRIFGLRTARGRCGSLLLHRKGLAPSTPCQSPGALRKPSHQRKSRRCLSWSLFDPELLRHVGIWPRRAGLRRRIARRRPRWRTQRERRPRYVDDASAMLGDFGIEKRPSKGFYLRQRAIPIKRQEPATSAAKIAASRRSTCAPLKMLSPRRAA
jgi:hypothetical protein